jgi:putative ABC transport system permease protein
VPGHSRRIDDDPRYAIEAQTESEYYAKQAESANALYILVIGIAVLAGIGAGFGAANTMYAAVQARTAEIGTLRALGFSRGSILWSFQLEAIVLAVLGFGMGAAAAVLLTKVIAALVGGVAFGARTFTTNVITLTVAPGDLVAALILSILIGLAGGLGPAWRAARLRPLEALRKA